MGEESADLASAAAGAKEGVTAQSDRKGPEREPEPELQRHAEGQIHYYGLWKGKALSELSEPAVPRPLDSGLFSPPKKEIASLSICALPNV